MDMIVPFIYQDISLFFIFGDKIGPYTPKTF